MPCRPSARLDRVRSQPFLQAMVYHSSLVVYFLSRPLAPRRRIRKSLREEATVEGPPLVPRPLRRPTLRCSLAHRCVSLTSRLRCPQNWATTNLAHCWYSTPVARIQSLSLSQRALCEICSTCRRCGLRHPACLAIHIQDPVWRVAVEARCMGAPSTQAPVAAASQPRARTLRPPHRRKVLLMLGLQLRRTSSTGRRKRRVRSKCTRSNWPQTLGATALRHSATERAPE
mmetsp:Transcript_1899/g.5381  ORF Transcript_1899/g.5381 Transcript_1899/m.5381 type:complete len:229 (+) Transcript_1899:361-1047(+)